MGPGRSRPGSYNGFERRPSPAATLHSVFDLGRHVDFPQTRANESQDAVKDIANQLRSGAHSRKLVRIFHRSQPFDQIIARNPSNLVTCSRIDGLFLRDRELAGRVGNRDTATTSKVANGLSGRAHEPVFCNVNACSADFLTSLKRIPAVREARDAALPVDEQNGRAAAKSREVEDVGEVSNEKGVGTKMRNTKPEPLDPAPV
jgi:hypothetical protein